MTDENSQFFAILTAVGRAKQANADALGVPWTFAQMGVGDANGTDPTPSEQQTQLINERRRAPLNQLKVDPANANVIIAEQVIPEGVGGWWIREVGLYDAAGDLVAVANCAPSFKPLLSQGSGRTQVVRMNLIVSNTANVDLKIDPSVVLATRQYVDSKVLEEINKLDFKHSVLVTTTANVLLTGNQTLDGIAVPAGSRVLVKNQAAAKDNGIYITAAGAWSRAPDADASIETTACMMVSVEKGTVNADSVWLLTTDSPIVLGTTPLVFDMIGGKKASQQDAEGFIDDTKWMTSLRVYQACMKIVNSVGLATKGAPLLGDFKAVVPGGLYLAYGELTPSKATPNAPPSSSSSTLGVLVITPRDDCTYYLVFENSATSGNRRFWMGQYNIPAGTLFWSGLLTTEQMATQEQVNAGVLDTVLVTPKTMRWGFSASFGANSYIIFPTWLGGLVIQSGSSVATNDQATVSFPVAFPTRCFWLAESDRVPAGGTIKTFWQFRDLTRVGFNALNLGSFTKGNTAWSAPTASGCTWFAVGY